MLDLLNKIELLKEELDHLEIFRQLDQARIEIDHNQELIAKIKEYNNTLSPDLRLDIYSYEEIKKYKKIENEINLIILAINSKLSAITEKRSCHNACN